MYPLAFQPVPLYTFLVRTPQAAMRILHFSNLKVYTVPLHRKCGHCSLPGPSAPPTMLHAMLVTCIPSECITNPRRQRIHFALNSLICILKEVREGKPSLCSPACLLFSMFCIPAQGPVFSPPDTSLQPGELPVAVLQCTSTSDTLSLLLTSPPSLEGAVWVQDPGGWSPSLSITVPGHQGPTISKAVLRSGCFQDSPFPFGFQY